MSLISFSLWLTQLFSLIAALQVSTVSAYPYNYGQWYGATKVREISSSFETQEASDFDTIDTSSRGSTPTETSMIARAWAGHQIQDGQIQMSSSSAATRTGYGTTITITVLAVSPSKTPTPTGSYNQMATPTSSAGDKSMILTSHSATSVSDQKIAPIPTGTKFEGLTSTSDTSCGEPTPDVYISFIGSIPFEITGVACPLTVTSTSGMVSPTIGSSVVLTTVPTVTTSPTVISSVSPKLPSSTTLIPDSSLLSLTTSAIQTATQPVIIGTNGSVITSLITSGQATSMPFLPVPVTTAPTSLSLVNISTIFSTSTTTTPTLSSSLQSTRIFDAIATDAPVAQIAQTTVHPAPRLGIQSQTQKLETNKFYSNFYLANQQAPVFTFPYSVSWSAGGGQTGSYGLSVSHTERWQLAVGPQKQGIDAGEWGYFVNPLGIQSLVLSATELSSGTSLTTDTLEAFSVNANLLAPGASTPTITFPLLQGIAFVTGVYNNATPLIQSGIGISKIAFIGTANNEAVFKYCATLFDGNTWLIYVTPTDSSYPANSFTLASPIGLQGSSGFSGTIQVAKLPVDSSSLQESTYDASAGTYPATADIDGTVSGASGSYSLSWTKCGIQSQPLLMFALPHHLESFDNATSVGLSSIELVTPTKGTATAIIGDSWTLNEPQLPTSMGFAPWSPSQGELKLVSDEAINAINSAGLMELSKFTPSQTNTGSTYYDGKALAKLAALVYTLSSISSNQTLSLTGLSLLESAFDLHVQNEMLFPLIYESAWGGVVSIETYTSNDPLADFGNGFYNDHHFHYGYFVYAAAVIAHLDPSWLSNPSNPAWVNLLIRDYANPSPSDPYFPFSRNFDWYHGHSWAQGLFQSYDGKDQESSSEDTMSLYAIKMWGHVTGDQSAEARGNMLLAVQARSLRNYYLMEGGSTVQPEGFAGNKAVGILFENKVDHTTYFGNDPSYIEGIHMLPIMPFSTLTRSRGFVGEEWRAYNWSEGGVNKVEGGWRGILMANYAIVDPVESYRFFSNASGDFELDYLDGGASLTWYLAWAAALGGSTGQEQEGAENVVVTPKVIQVSDDGTGEDWVGDNEEEEGTENTVVTAIVDQAESDLTGEKWAVNPGEEESAGNTAVTATVTQAPSDYNAETWAASKGGPREEQSTENTVITASVIQASNGCTGEMWARDLCRSKND